MRPRPRWFYCRGEAWRVVRRPEWDTEHLEGWAVYRGGNIQPTKAGVVPGGTLRDQMVAAVRETARKVVPEAKAS